MESNKKETSVVERLTEEERQDLLTQLKNDNSYKLTYGTRIRDRLLIPINDSISQKFKEFGTHVAFYLGKNDELKAFMLNQSDTKVRIGQGAFGEIRVITKGHRLDQKETKKENTVLKSAKTNSLMALKNEDSILKEIELYNAKHKDNPKEQIPYAKYKGSIKYAKGGRIGYITQRGGKNLNGVMKDEVTITDKMWADLGNGLDNLHNKMGIVHSDIKPDNIIFKNQDNKINNCDNELIFCDFGLSKKKEELTPYNYFSGSLDFMPNFIKNKVNQNTNKNDLYEIKKKQDWYGLLTTMIIFYDFDISKDAKIIEKLDTQETLNSNLWKEMYQSLSGMQNQNYQTQEAQDIQILKKEGIDNKSIIKLFAKGNL